MSTSSLPETIDSLESLLDDDARVDQLIQEAVQDALQEHKRKGESIVVWRDGKVVTLTADEIPERIAALPPSGSVSPSTHSGK